MFDNTVSMFEGYRSKLKKIKKKTYEERFAIFFFDNRACFEDMFQYIVGREDTEVAAKEVANIFAENVFAEYGNAGKLSASDKTDLSLFMIYFVFPSILKLENANSKVLCDMIRDEWRKRTDNPAFDYTTYEDLHGSFQEKIFGIF
ncbi:MAG: hypothetical protein K6E49_04370 [Lachnospiraceae bacterium]|nr:hypothetical protein [Lachnospiraceae bacterium]